MPLVYTGRRGSLRFSGDKERDQWYEIGQPILVPCHISIPPENVRKPMAFWRFQGVSKRDIGLKGFNQKRFNKSLKRFKRPSRLFWGHYYIILYHYIILLFLSSSNPCVEGTCSRPIITKTEQLTWTFIKFLYN